MSDKEFSWLFKRDSTGGVRQWRIVVEGDSFYTESGVVGGKINRSKPNRATPKNDGKSNATTAEEQALVEAQAKWDKKKKTGYFLSLDDVDDAFRGPMLAKNFKDRKDKISYPVAVEEKLNGVRCVGSWEALVSRKNETFHTIPHIRQAIHNVFPDSEELFLDGELYNPELKENLNQLLKLVSVAIKEPTQERLDESLKVVQYHVYDGYGFLHPATGKKVTAETPFQLRREALQLILGEANYACLQVIQPFKLCYNEEEVAAEMQRFVKDGGEGAIVRDLHGAYEHKRSKNLLKLKQFFDREFKILGVDEGRGNWAGCVMRVYCEIPSYMRVPG
jgi:ATP-dependent DNA ligase